MSLHSSAINLCWNLLGLHPVLLAPGKTCGKLGKVTSLVPLPKFPQPALVNPSWKGCSEQQVTFPKFPPWSVFEIKRSARIIYSSSPLLQHQGWGKFVRLRPLPPTIPKIAFLVLTDKFSSLHLTLFQKLNRVRLG